MVERVEYRSDRVFISGHRSTEKFELAADAVVVDTTGKPVKVVVDEVMRVIRAKYDLRSTI